MEYARIKVTAKLLKHGVIVRMVHTGIGHIGHTLARHEQKRPDRHVLAQNDRRRKASHRLQIGHTVGRKRVGQKAGLEPQMGFVGQVDRARHIGVIEQPGMCRHGRCIGMGQLPAIGTGHGRIGKHRYQARQGVLV